MAPSITVFSNGSTRWPTSRPPIHPSHPSRARSGLGEWSQPAHQVQSDLRTSTLLDCHRLKICLFSYVHFCLALLLYRQLCTSTVPICLITSNLMPRPRKPVELTRKREAPGLRDGVSASSTYQRFNLCDLWIYSQPKIRPPTILFYDFIKSSFRE